MIIGERINPTGKKKFKQALRDGDINYILSEGLKQEDAGGTYSRCQCRFTRN